MSKANKIKAIVKGVAPKETFGTNPSDPWSTKANIAEWAGNPTGLLGKYLKSRGINPKFATKDQKIAHSKTGQFQKWQRDHEERSSPTGTTIRGESSDMCNVCGQTPCNCTSIDESVDKKDTVVFDIPLLIRVLELAREDIKSDMDLHRVVERLIDIRNKGVLTMDDYDTIAAIKEEVYSSVPLAHIKQALSEAKEANYGGDYQDSVLALKAKAEKKKVDMKSLADRMQAAYRRENQKNVKEETLDETWKYHTYPDNTVARAAVKAHHEFRDEKGMASGNPARAMGNGKVAYKGEFKGPKPQKQVAEGLGKYIKRAAQGWGGAQDKPADIVKRNKSYDTDTAKKVRAHLDDAPDHTPAGLQKRVLDRKLKGVAEGKEEKIAQLKTDHATAVHWSKNDTNPHKREAARQKAEKIKRHLETQYKQTVSEGNGYDDNRTGFAKKPREDDEGHAPTKFKAKSIMDRPHTVHIDGKPWKKFSSGHQAHAAVNTLTAKGKKAVAIAHFKEDTYQDPQAATQTVFDGGNNPNDITPPEYKGKRLIQMSKSARIIKSIYKNKGMKEETYDFEKADKSVAPYGKPPKMAKTDKKITDGDKEQAAIVLSGGKTLTGDERDTIEIDPKMKMRPNQPEPTKNGKPQVK